MHKKLHFSIEMGDIQLIWKKERRGEDHAASWNNNITPSCTKQKRRKKATKLG